jgi:cyclase
MKLAHCCVACLLLGGLPLTAGAQPGVLKQVVPGVWFREGEMDLSHCNNAVIEMADYLVVVDANYPSGARALIDDIKTVSTKPIKYVIDTHADADHAYGNPIFTKLGATTIAYVGALEEMKRYEPKMWRQTAGWRKDVAELNLPGPEPPQKTFSENPYVISDGSRRVELYHFGFGHTRGDCFVYLPKEKVLCTGDVVVNGPYNDPNRAYLGNWANEIRPTLKFEVEHVLPGHGSAGGRELLTGQIKFFEELYKAVETAVKQGKTLEQIVTMKDGKPVATSIELSAAVADVYIYHGPILKPWQATRFATQVRNTYEEITQGKPYGEIVGGK